jgi:hypothetical protein
MNKDKLSMYVDITKITIVLCWVSLVAFWCLKIFGGEFFEIMVENENFIKFSELVQNTWLKYLLSFITVVGGNYLMFGAIAQKFLFKGKDLIVVIAMLISIWAVSNFVPLEFLGLGFWYGYALLIIFGIITQKGWKKCFGIIAILLQFAFTSISMVTRNIPLQVSENYLVVLILIIDLYIMYGLYYLYSNLIKLKSKELL